MDILNRFKDSKTYRDPDLLAVVAAVRELDTRLAGLETPTPTPTQPAPAPPVAPVVEPVPVVEVEPEPGVEPEPLLPGIEETEPEKPVNLEELTWHELQRLARIKKLDVYGKNKREVIRAIRAER